MTADTHALEARLLDFLRRELGVDEPGLGADTALVTTGLVVSVGLVRLATFVERQLGIRIPDRDIKAEHFDTIRRIEAYVQRGQTR